MNYYFFDAWIFYFQNGDYDKAQTILHIALKMAQDMDHFDAVSYIFNLLADMAFDKVSNQYRQIYAIYVYVLIIS